MKTKSIKDTIHGYIRVEEPFWRIIDTAEFQRLKWIEQTSYRVLYPSARHDRFVHSIGVYYLGQKAVDGFIKNCGAEDVQLILKYRNSFLLACILHDIGHAPFSHTCEDLYNYQDKINNIECPLNSQLLNLYKDCAETEVYTAFVNDYRYIIKSTDEVCKAPSEHEVMSAILTIRNFRHFQAFFEQDAYLDLDLTIRSILGCVYAVKRSYSSTEKQNYGIKNCLIRLLNSSTVDVDKLDYIARDTQMSGYDNVVLDSERLLDSTCFVITDDDIYYPAFKKSALSVIDNVVLAKNSQARWIVNHPIVLYDAYLLRRAIGISIKNMYDNKYTGSTQITSFEHLLKSIFSSEALSKGGFLIDDCKIGLLSDVELLNWMKQNISAKEVSEYFSRDERKSPIWKSHEEFLFYLETDREKAVEVSSFIAPLMTYLNTIEDLYLTKVINKDLEAKINAEDIDGKEEMLRILEALNSYQDAEGNSEFEYVILPAKNTFFAKINARHVYIRFGEDERKYANYEKIKEESLEINYKKYEFFYLFADQKIDAGHFLEYLYGKAHDSGEVRT